MHFQRWLTLICESYARTDFTRATLVEKSTCRPSVSVLSDVNLWSVASATQSFFTHFHRHQRLLYQARARYSSWIYQARVSRSGKFPLFPISPLFKFRSLPGYWCEFHSWRGYQKNSQRRVCILFVWKCATLKLTFRSSFLGFLVSVPFQCWQFLLFQDCHDLIHGFPAGSISSELA